MQSCILKIQCTFLEENQIFLFLYFEYQTQTHPLTAYESVLSDS